MKITISSSFLLLFFAQVLSRTAADNHQALRGPAASNGKDDHAPKDDVHVNLSGRFLGQSQSQKDASCKIYFGFPGCYKDCNNSCVCDVSDCGVTDVIGMCKNCPNGNGGFYFCDDVFGGSSDCGP